MWDWGFAWEILPRLIVDGLVVTIQLTLLGTGFAMIAGLVLAVAKRSSFWLVSAPVSGLIEFVRSTPLIVQLYFLFFVLPVFGIRLSPFVTGVVGLGVHYATYTAEVYRAGIESVPRGQWEASRALNFSVGDTWTKVVLPQAVPPVIPALGNYLISMFKDTPFVIVVTLTELFGVSQEICSETFQCLEAYSLVGILFLVVSYPSALLVRRLEARYGRPIAS